MDFCTMAYFVLVYYSQIQIKLILIWKNIWMVLNSMSIWQTFCIFCGSESDSTTSLSWMSFGRGIHLTGVTVTENRTQLMHPKTAVTCSSEAVFMCWCVNAQRCVILSTAPSPVSFKFCCFLENPFVLSLDGWMGCRQTVRWLKSVSVFGTFFFF